MAHYTKQKSGLYRAAIQIGYKADGKPLKKYLSAPTIRELEQKIADTRTDIASGLIVTDVTTFGDYAERWLRIYKGTKSIQTRKMYAKALKHLSEMYPVPLRKVNRMMVQSVINDNSEHPRTCEQILLTIRQIFESARDDGLIGRNPCMNIEMPRHIPNEKRALTEEEKNRLRSAILQPQERLLLLLLYGLGCRPAEAFALTKSDFDYDAGTVSINKAVQYDGNKVHSVGAPKTNSSIRSVIVPEGILRALKRIIDKIPHENILGGQNGQIMTLGKYRTIFNQILKKSGLADSGITMYTFRHNYATECRYNGVSLKECQQQMGHKSANMIMEVYEHLDPKKENTAAKLSAMSI